MLAGVIMELNDSLSQSQVLTSVYSAQQVLENEEQVARGQGIALYELMQSAGEAVFKALLKQWPDAKNILIVAGKGNNGGDAFIVALLAYQAGLQVKVQLTCLAEQLKGDAQLAYQAMILAGMSDLVFDANLAECTCLKVFENINDFNGDVIVDALFGIGFKGELTDSTRKLVRTVNQHKSPILSIDVPSGLCATTGFASGSAVDEQAVIAQLTITFIVYKQGLLTGQSANFVGKLQLASLGLTKAFTDCVISSIYYQRQADINSLPKRLACHHKGDSGLLLAIGAGDGMPGSIRLTSEAALRCGAGLVAVCCAQENQTTVISGRPELMLTPSMANELVNSVDFNKAKAFVLGPGLGLDERAKQLVFLTLQKNIGEDKPIVIDADALILLSQYSQSDIGKLTNSAINFNKWILTPHPKEAASLLGCAIDKIEADRFTAVRALAKEYNAICILKGAGTLISDGRQVVINSSGNAGMASGGMGDVLSGIIGALVMKSANNFNSVCTAVYIHGASADIMVKSNGPLGLLASDLFLPLQRLINNKV